MLVRIRAGARLRMGTVQRASGNGRSSRRHFLAAAACLSLASACRVRSESPTDDDRFVTLPYGPHVDNVGDLWRPKRTPDATIVLVHGGFWSSRHGRDLMSPLAADSAARGLLCWNIEFRRVGQSGGGWPGIFHDVAAAIDHLVVLADGGEPVDLSRVVVVGHSSGGHLALWAAARTGLPDDAPGARPLITPAAAVSLAGVADLVGAARRGVGGVAVRELLGGEPDEVDERYALASPLARLPLGIRTRCVHGRHDDVVPLAQSAVFVEAAASAGDPADLVVFDGGHFEVLDPGHESWRAVLALVEEVA